VNDLWYKSFLGGRARDGYNEPVAAEEGWWNGLEGVVGEVLVLAGGDEVLVDCIRVLGGRLAVSSFLLCVCVCVYLSEARIALVIGNGEVQVAGHAGQTLHCESGFRYPR